MIRKRFPDRAKAEGIVATAEKNISAIERLEIDSITGPLITSTIYESFRMLGDALLTAEGFETEGKDHHSEMIGRLMQLKVNANRSLLVLDELRRKRNKINYDGYLPTQDEVKDVIAVKNSLWKPLLEEIKFVIKRQSF